MSLRLFAAQGLPDWLGHRAASHNRLSEKGTTPRTPFCRVESPEKGPSHSEPIPYEKAQPVAALDAHAESSVSGI